jgi:hypothetical protein
MRRLQPAFNFSIIERLDIWRIWQKRQKSKRARLFRFVSFLLLFCSLVLFCSSDFLLCEFRFYHSVVTTLESVDIYKCIDQDGSISVTGTQSIGGIGWWSTSTTLVISLLIDAALLVLLYSLWRPRRQKLKIN